jgi:diguanylate cyclase (GGDEF)-like protein
MPGTHYELLLSADTDSSPALKALVNLVTTSMQQLMLAKEACIVLFSPTTEPDRVINKLPGLKIVPGFHQPAIAAKKEVLWLNEKNGLPAGIGITDPPFLYIPMETSQGLKGAIVISAPTSDIPHHVLIEIGKNAAVVFENSLLQQTLEDKIRYLSDYDDLVTKLPNRRVLNQSIQQAINMLTGGQHCSFFFIDLDDLKRVNRQVGYASGDKVLFLVAQRITDFAQKKGISAVPARIGGDEFGLIITGVHTREAISDLATAIIDDISQPLQVDGISYTITASIGITTFPSDAKSVDELLLYAERAMFMAKDKGKNTHVFFHKL